MFDTMKIAAIIKQARIDQNMTQMNLADAMGVSYQAVSNWERGNSMPDISKLEDLCRVLNITVEQLLGMETPAAAAVNKVIHEEALTVEELKEVAPVLPPQELKKQVKAEKKRKKLRLDAIAEMAPFLGQDYLDELLADADLEDLDGLEDIAPFLSKPTLDRLVERVPLEDLDEISDIAPFLSKSTVDKLVYRCVEEGQIDGVEDLAPFLSDETLEKVVEKARAEDLEELAELACHLSQQALDKLLRRCEAAGEWETISEIACFLREQSLNELVDRLIAREFDPEEMDELSDLYPFLSKGALRKLAKYLMDCRDLDALEDLMPFA